MMSTNGTGNVMTFEPLSASERAGVIVVASFALLSTLAVGFIVLRTIRLATAVFLRSEDTTSRPPEILFFHTQLGHYGACLILSNLLLSVAGLLNFSWVPAALSQGSVCLAQVVLRQVGIWSTCWFTATLGVHTHISFVFHLRPARWRSLVIAALGWTSAFAAALVPLQINNVYGLTSSSCGVTRFYPIDIFAFDVLPVILATFVSIVVHSVTFLVLHGKLSVGSSNVHRGEDRSEGYHGFISTIIYTIFWFPLAFVLLLLPFCVTHIMMYAGRSVPSAPGVFADACVSMLGFVNVCLLYNTFRVINPVYRERPDKLATDTMRTFGNDASGESPVAPPPPPNSQRTSLWSQQTSPEMYSRTNPTPNHSRDSSWASVDSNTELLGKEKALYENTEAKAVPLVLIGGQLGGHAAFRSTGPDPRSRMSYVARGSGMELLKQVDPCSSQPETDVRRKGGKELIFKSKVSPALDLPSFLDLPQPFPLEGMDESSILAARHGAHAALSPVVEIPRIEVNTWGPEHAEESNSQPRSPSDDLGYLGDTAHAINVRPLPQPPELNDDEYDDFLPCQQSMRARSQRTTMTTIWSQETGCTLSPPDTAVREIYPGPVANLLSPGMMLGDRADVGGVASRPASFVPSRKRSDTLRAVEVASRLTARVSDMLSPRSPGIKDFRIVVAPSDGVV